MSTHVDSELYNKAFISNVRMFVTRRESEIYTDDFPPSSTDFEEEDNGTQPTD
jgi:hypothetical protein